MELLRQLLGKRKRKSVEQRAMAYNLAVQQRNADWITFLQGKEAELVALVGDAAPEEELSEEDEWL